jgi:histidinol-phosphate aminotransferase
MNQLIDRIAEKHGLTRDHVVLTGGSSEGLHITGLTYGVHGGEIISAHPTFQALMSYAENFGAFINRVPLTEDFQHDLDEMERRVSNNTRLIFLCNPNNPTGTLLPADQITDFCHRVSKQTLIFSDEAYYDYIELSDYPSMVDLVKEGQNIIVSRTFSKVYGLAGLRIGYLLARPDIAQRLNKSVAAGTNVLAIHAALTAMEDQPFYQFCLEQNRLAKKHIYSVLDDLKLTYQRSQTNFVFFQSGQDITELVGKMNDKGVRVGRPFPPYTDWCRISTGKIDEVKKFGVALKEVLG